MAYYFNEPSRTFSRYLIVQDIPQQNVPQQTFL